MEPYQSNPDGSPPGGAQPPEELPARGGHAADAGSIAATGEIRKFGITSRALCHNLQYGP